MTPFDLQLIFDIIVGVVIGGGLLALALLHSLERALSGDDE